MHSPGVRTVIARLAGDRLAEQPPLRRRVKRIGVEAQVAQMVGELGRAVRAEDLPRLDAPHGLDELVVVGVVRERQRMIDAQAILRALRPRPNRYRDRNRSAQIRQAKLLRSPRQRDDGVAVERPTVEYSRSRPDRRRTPRRCG